MKNVFFALLILASPLFYGCGATKVEEPAVESKEKGHTRTESQFLPELGGFGSVTHVVTDEEYQEELLNSPVLAASEANNGSGIDPGLQIYTGEDIDQLAKKRKAMMDRPSAL